MEKALKNNQNYHESDKKKIHFHTELQQLSFVFSSTLRSNRKVLVIFSNIRQFDAVLHEEDLLYF